MKSVRCIILITLMLLPFSLSARPYIGLSQGNVSTSLELGMVGRRAEQSLSLSVPTLESSSPLTMPSVQARLFFRTQRFSPIVLGVGLLGAVGWQDANAWAVGLGGSVALSYEFIAKRGILFVEGSYLPLLSVQGTAVDPAMEHQMKQYVRIGYRQVL